MPDAEPGVASEDSGRPRPPRGRLRFVLDGTRSEPHCRAFGRSFAGPPPSQDDERRGTVVSLCSTFGRIDGVAAAQPFVMKQPRAWSDNDEPTPRNGRDGRVHVVEREWRGVRRTRRVRRTGSRRSAYMPPSLRARLEPGAVRPSPG